MGLDTVELVLAYEEAFGITIPNAAAEKMCTPRDVADFVERELAQPVQTLPFLKPKARGLLRLFPIPTRSPRGSRPNKSMTRTEIAAIIREITLNQLGLDPSEYAEDKTFVGDFGAD